jgi:hypothetical protein
VNESDTAIWMRRLAARSRNGDALPDPALIWWQARLRERQEARTRAARPLAIAQWTSAVVAIAVVAALCVVYWPGMRDMLQPLATLTAWVAAGSAIILMGLAARLVFGD